MAMHIQMYPFTQVPRWEGFVCRFFQGCTEILNQDHHHGPELKNREVSETTRELPSRTLPSLNGYTPLRNTDFRETALVQKNTGPLSQQWWLPRVPVPQCLGAPDTFVFRDVGLQTAFLNKIELHKPGLPTHQGMHSQYIDSRGDWRAVLGPLR